MTVSPARTLQRTLRLALTSAVVLGFPLTSVAQGGFGRGDDGSKPRMINVLVGGGLTVPTGGDFKAQNQNGFHFDGAVIFRLPGLPIALRPQVSVATFSSKRQPNNGPIAQPRALELNKSRLLSGFGNIEVPFAAGVYVMGGVGATNLSTNFAGDSLSDAKATSLILDVGAGYRFDFGRIKGYVEARVGSAAFDKQKIGYSRTQFVPMTFGLMF